VSDVAVFDEEDATWVVVFDMTWQSTLALIRVVLVHT
jgi:hypothetical protein